MGRIHRVTFFGTISGSIDSGRAFVFIFGHVVLDTELRFDAAASGPRNREKSTPGRSTR